MTRHLLATLLAALVVYAAMCGRPIVGGELENHAEFQRTTKRDRAVWLLSRHAQTVSEVVR